ncbi:MAG: phage tail protein [Clostridiales bacterium]|nr:phage tail protein [Clostridiales bacterium]
MANDFGVQIGVDGEREFKKALADINQQFKVLGSEMRVVVSEFDKQDKSVEAVTARNDVLNKSIDTQRDKIRTLESALNNATKSFGENDKRTQNWTIRLNNAKAELNGMERELSNNEKSLDDMGKEEDDAAKSADNLGDKLTESANAAEKSESKFNQLGGVLKGIGTAMGTVALAAGAAAGKLGQEVIAAYADYEQLVGGVDTLFEDSSQAVQNYASNAFKTAGMSANEYMETVTGFSASLIASLGGDTEAAAGTADQIITDMSDNANKMGTSLAAIQTTYQGFAKQNYTMLDNLKLGYGGTEKEMERLLIDAEKISGVKYDLSSFADVTEAIHVMQTEMGITGTTAREAASTIGGSIAGMQSAIQNLMAGFGNANADVGMLVYNVVNGFQTVLQNITPVIENIVAALPGAFDGILQAVGELLPTLLQTGTDLFTQMLATILLLLPELIPAAVQAVMTIVQALIENIPLLIDAAMQLITALVEGISEAVPTLIPAAVEAINTIVTGLIENLPLLLDAALQLILGLADGLLAAIPQLIEKLPAIITAIVEFVISSIPQIIETGIKLLESLVTALPEIITAIVAAIPQIIDGIITAVLDNIPLLVDAGIKLFVALVENLPEIILTIVKAIPKIITSIVTALTGEIPRIVEVGGNIVKGLWEGIQAMATWIKDKVSGFFGGIVDGVKGLLGIHSPSTVFAGIGDNMAQGLGEGFVSSMHNIEKDMKNVIPTDFDTNIRLNGYSGNSPVNIAIPVMLDGKIITKSTSRIQSGFNKNALRAVGVT